MSSRQSFADSTHNLSETDLLWQRRRPYSPMRHKPDLNAVSDDELLRRLSELLKDSRRVEADLVAHIAEVDARKLYAREAAPSMFAYCTEVLHLSEHEAFLRITVARASREHPMLLAMLRDGRLHLSGISKLAPHLTARNREALLKRAVHRSKRQIEELVAEVAPRPAVPAMVRRLPNQRVDARPASILELGPDRAADSRHELGRGQVGAASEELASEQADSRHRQPALGEVASMASELGPDRAAAAPRLRPAAVEPVGPARFRVRFDASAELREKLERLQALMRSSVPDGDLAKIIDVAVTKELERLEARRFAKTKAPRKRLGQTDTTPKSRYIPAAVRRFVQKRDGGRCTYRDKHGRRCTKRHDLEFHHRKPFGRGGEHSPEVLCLVCKTHNLLLAEQDFGKEKMARYRRRANRDTKPVSVVGDGSGQGGLLARWRSSG